MTSYQEFLDSKRRRPPESGIPCTPADIDPALFDFQRHITAWAVRRGRAAIWADTGLGKTRMQVAWLIHVLATGGRGLILAPLAVAEQTIREAAAIGVALTYVRNQAEADAAPTRYVISNYDRLHLLNPAAYDAVVLDESSILKAYSGTMKRALIAAFAETRYEAHGDNWALYNGDSAEVLAALPDRSVDLAVFSPPFSSTYTYSPSDRDLGNVPVDDWDGGTHHAQCHQRHAACLAVRLRRALDGPAGPNPGEETSDGQ